jgi:uncharacterized protein
MAESKYIVEMTVRAGVHQQRLAGVDYATAVGPLIAKARRMMPYFVAFLLVAGAIIFAVSCKGSTVAFSNNSTVETLQVEVADTPGARDRGLSNRDSLPGDEGMLFDFGGETSAVFWMKDTSIPLSIAFIDSEEKVIEIRQLEPFDLTPVKPEGSYRYAIEANRGWFEEHGIRQGFRVSIDI